MADKFSLARWCYCFPMDDHDTHLEMVYRFFMTAIRYDHEYKIEHLNRPVAEYSHHVSIAIRLTVDIHTENVVSDLLEKHKWNNEQIMIADKLLGDYQADCIRALQNIIYWEITPGVTENPLVNMASAIIYIVQMTDAIMIDLPKQVPKTRADGTLVQRNTKRLPPPKARS